MKTMVAYSGQDVFLWLKHPVIDEMRAVLKWAYTRALRKDIHCGEIGCREKRPSERDFGEIVSHIDRDAKMFFRIVVRKGFNRWMVLDQKKDSDILDIGIHCVKIGTRFYNINLYLNGALLGPLKRRFALTEHLR